ncbi:MAG TPA: glutamine amidotransferase [Kofleriaceae bacterium]|nr:glutamine amidotransferase [Kofleriaceae bacterium]
MSVGLFSDTLRLALLIVGGVAALAAALMAWRRVRAGLVVLATAIAVAALGAAGIEQIVAWLVASSAPDAADFNQHRWVLLAPWGRAGIALGLACAAAVMALSVIAATRVASPWRRAALIGLRAVAAGCAVILFLEPAVELRQVAREPNRVAVLLDDSLSMSLRDRSGGPTRAERARALVTASADTFRAWRGEHQVDFYTFSDALVAASEEAVGTAPPAGKATLMRQALEQVRARYQGDDLAGVVLVSDGIGTGDFAQGAGSGAGRDFLRSLDTVVHTAWAAQPGLKDVSVARILADEFAFARTVVEIEAVLRSTGYGARRVQVTLSSDGKPLRKKWVDIPGGTQEVRVAFEFTPAKVGKYVYEISTPVADDEAVAENNARSTVLRVIRDKIRVLQVSGQPSWDVRALRGMLKQNPNVDLISFFILRTMDDINYASNDELSLIPFPTHELFEEQLPSFDMIVLQNFDYLPYGIAPYLDNIKSYVEGGGGLVMLGGSLSFASGGYGDTPIADVLPVTLAPSYSPVDSVLDDAPFAPALTEQGRVHPITALRFEPSDNVAAWKALPALEGINLVEGVRKDALVLAVHPRLKTRGGAPMPLISAWQAGEGRALAITTGSLWRWGFVAASQAGNDGGAYFKLWDNALRWLMDDPDMRFLRVESDRIEYAPDAVVRLAVHLSDRDYRPRVGGTVTLDVSRGSDPATAQRVARAALTTGEGGDASHELGRLEPGVYRVVARAKVGDRQVEAQDIFLIREASEELSHPAPTEELLQVIAQATGGRHLGAVDELPDDLELAEPRIVRVDRRTDVELWSRPWLLVLALLCLGLEWALRGRIGYL